MQIGMKVKWYQRLKDDAEDEHQQALVVLEDGTPLIIDLNGMTDGLTMSFKTRLDETDLVMYAKFDPSLKRQTIQLSGSRACYEAFSLEIWGP